MIDAGVRQLRRALGHERPGPYQLQALIAACHATAPSAGETDWDRIAGLYDRLVLLVPSDTVRLNRAVAVAMSAGPAQGLAGLDAVTDHPLLPAVRADLLRRLGRRTEAAGEYRRALARTAVEGERAYLRRRLAECAGLNAHSRTSATGR
jgi:RNA polymerase sigma-70 factor (ECF subfamily)